MYVLDLRYVIRLCILLFVYLIGNVKYGAIRSEALSVTEVVLNKLAGGGCFHC